MTVSQYDHVVPYTDLGVRGYFGVNAALVLVATDNVSAGEWNAKMLPKQEWVLWGETDPVFHCWQYTLLIQRFPFIVWSNYSHGKYHASIMRYLQPCEVALAIQLLQDGSTVRLVARRFGNFESLASTLGELDKGTEGPQHINRTGISFVS